MPFGISKTKNKNLTSTFPCISRTTNGASFTITAPSNTAANSAYITVAAFGATVAITSNNNANKMRSRNMQW